MEFKKYQHVEKLGTQATHGLLEGECFVFPKIDGSNGSIWYEDGEIKCGSRNRVLSLDDDNQGFAKWVETNRVKLMKFFHLNEAYILYGEWLVPHTIRYYDDNAWGNFYVFDVYNTKNDRYVSYDFYSPVLDKHGIDYIPCVGKGINLDENSVYKLLDNNTYLLSDDAVRNGKLGEGVVVKNYDFTNRFGKIICGKIVRQEFKDRNLGEFKTRTIQDGLTVESQIVSKYLTPSLIEKEYSKMVENEEWSPRRIPELLGRIWHEFIVEELFEAVSKEKNPIVDFKKLKKECDNKVKAFLNEVF